MSEFDPMFGPQTPENDQEPAFFDEEDMSKDTGAQFTPFTPFTPRHPVDLDDDPTPTYVPHRTRATVATRILGRFQATRTNLSRLPKRQARLAALAIGLVMLLCCSSASALWLLQRSRPSGAVLAAAAASVTASDGTQGVGSPTPTYPVYVNGQPTWTPIPYATSTPVNGNGNSNPTATPTNGPPPSPTATPDPHGGSATVSFTRAAQNVSVPTALTACDGCSLDTGAGTIPSIYVSYSLADTYGQYLGNAQVINSSGVVTLELACLTGVTPCSFSGGTTIYPTLGGASCILQGGNSGFTSATSVNCTVAAGYHCVNYQYTKLSSNTVEVTGPGNACYGSSYTAYYVPSNCLSAGNNGNDVSTDAENKVMNYVRSQGLADTLSGPSYSFAALHCSDSRGNWLSPGDRIPSYSGQYFSQRRDASAYRYTYTAHDGINLQTMRLANAVPSGYTLASSSVCDSPTIGAVDLNAHRAALTCNAIGTAWYNWSTAQSNSLAQQVAGMSASQAQSIIASTTGVGGNISISINGGKTLLPNDPSNITIVVNHP